MVLSVRRVYHLLVEMVVFFKLNCVNCVVACMLHSPHPDMPHLKVFAQLVCRHGYCMLYDQLKCSTLIS